jgi:hypothetical protein
MTSAYKPIRRNLFRPDCNTVEEVYERARKLAWTIIVAGGLSCLICALGRAEYVRHDRTQCSQHAGGPHPMLDGSGQRVCRLKARKTT